MSEQIFAHRLPAVRPFAQSPNEERIRRIHCDRWIGYPLAEAALAALDDLMDFPQRTRMPNLALIGASNNGKSMIIEKFCRRHARATDTEAKDAPPSMPVLKIQMPHCPDEKQFFGAIFEELGASYRLNAHLFVRHGTAMKLIRAACVRIVVIDELHNILVGQRTQQRRFLNLLRWMGNELRIPLVAAGTAEALRAIHSDDQLANRFAPFKLPLWQMGPEYLRLLNTLEAVIPLRQRSGLAEPALAHKIMALAEGVLGEIITVVTSAAVHAIASASEIIDAQTLDRLNYLPPSQRRNATV